MKVRKRKGEGIRNDLRLGFIYFNSILSLITPLPTPSTRPYPYSPIVKTSINTCPQKGILGGSIIFINLERQDIQLRCILIEKSFEN